jgi:hypothetical protein
MCYFTTVQKSFEKEIVYYGPLSRLYKDALLAATNYLLSDVSVAESRRSVSEPLKFRNGLLGIFGFTSRNILKMASLETLDTLETLENIISYIKETSQPR